MPTTAAASNAAISFAMTSCLSVPGSAINFKIPRLLAELSLGLTLEPGDVLSTGTPPGVGFARTPPEYLKPGDVVETEIVGLGAMRNVIG